MPPADQAVVLIHTASKLGFIPVAVLVLGECPQYLLSQREVTAFSSRGGMNLIGGGATGDKPSRMTRNVLAIATP